MSVNNGVLMGHSMDVLIVGRKREIMDRIG
jgi:hypothetical protein